MRRTPGVGEFRADLLAERIRNKRGTRGLRVTASEIEGVTSSTLSRIENGKVPDLDTFVRLCRWLEASPTEFIPGYEDQRSDVGTPEAVAAHFRADKILSKKTAEALAAMVSAMYEAARKGQLPE